MQNRIKTTSATFPGLNALLPALFLAGCGSNPAPDADFESRLAAVEKKAEQAEVRSKEALTMAASGSSSSSGGAAQPEEFPEEIMPEEDPYNGNTTYNGNTVPGQTMIGPPSQNMQAPPLQQ